jgi:hypothetical protein
MEEIAASSGSHYFWTPPGGVYGAMRESIPLVRGFSYVWWVNSGDWLASTESIKAVVDLIITCLPQERPSWIIGSLTRLETSRGIQRKVAGSGDEFFAMMKNGAVGFPHPATIFQVEKISSINPYGRPLSIASDYSTALRFGREFGPPALLPTTLTVHVADGLSSRNPIRNFLQKSRARIEEFPETAFLEPLRLLRAVLGVLARFSGKNVIPIESVPQPDLWN